MFTPITIKGYTIEQAAETGGKAGKGKNRTSTIRVFKNRIIQKQFVYRIKSLESKEKAIQKAKNFIAGL